MLSLWQMSLGASAVILLTALLRYLAGPRLPRRMYVALWDVALLSSLIPFRVPWEALARRIPDRAATIAGAWTGAPLPTVAVNAMVAENAAPAAMPMTVLPAVSGVQRELAQATQTLRETAQSAPVWLWQALGVVWGVGAIALATVLLSRWLTCRRAFAEALPCRDQRVAAFLQAHPMRRRIRVRVSNRIGSPLSYGLLRPVILLPASLSRADDQRLGYVLTHEFLHIRAWDMLRKSALLLALCLHWPNPLIWLMTRLFTRDMELMCDERVVRRLGGRKAYCLTLLDMEAQRSNLTMGTCFSVTGIEERIKVMKNRKHQSILSITLAFAIFLGAAVGAVTGIPMADAESASPRIFISSKTWETAYAQYAPYGLGYDEKNGTITYNGQVVRYFEDMWPIDEQGKTGTCFQYEAGVVDVYGVREFPEIILRNPDGSFDPSGILIGLREATKEEYDEHTLRMQAGHLTQGTTTFQVMDTGVLLPGGSEQIAVVKPSDIEWWTAEEFREWLDAERVALQELVGEQVQAWTPSTGWFTWTQEKVDETIALYENTLRDIEQGALVSKRINGEDANMTLVQSLGETTFSTISTDVASDALFSASVPAVAGLTDDGMILFGYAGADGEDTIPYSQHVVEDSVEQPSIVFKVSPTYKINFSPETWAQIEQMIAQDAIEWETVSPATYETDGAYQSARMEGWRETIAPYAAFGLSFGLDSETDIVHLYWNGREVRGVFDPVLGTWITEHTGLGHYPEGAKELIAVYENGTLTGLREADAEESAVWDKLRKENMNP